MNPDSIQVTKTKTDDDGFPLEVPGLRELRPSLGRFERQRTLNGPSRYAVVFFQFSNGAWYKPCFKGSYQECEDVVQILNAAACLKELRAQ